MLGVEEYEQAWPEISQRVVAGLRSRGVAADVAEEAVQEAAARAWRSRPVVASIDELARWTYTVARRVVIDGHRRRRVPTVSLDASLDGSVDGSFDGELPTTSDGVESRVLARLDLDRAARALGELRAVDRSVLLASVAPVEGVAGRDRKAVVRDAVRLHRARARLAEVFGKLGGILGGAWWERVRRMAAIVAKVSVPVAAAVGVAILLGGALWNHAHDPDASPPSDHVRPVVVRLERPAAAVAPAPAGPAVKHASHGTATSPASSSRPADRRRTITLPVPRNVGGVETPDGGVKHGGHGFTFGGLKPSNIVPAAACVDYVSTDSVTCVSDQLP